MICLKAIAAGFCAHLATARAESEAGSDAHELVRNHVRSPPHARLRGRGGGPVQTVAETKRQLNDLVASGRLMRTMVGQAAAYAAAKPFPHAVIDGLFPDLVIRALMSEIQERPSTGYRCYKNPALEFNKCEESKTERMGPHTVAYLSFVRSSGFIEALEALSGFGNPLDPRYGKLTSSGLHGAGIHVTGDKGKLQVHADFNIGKNNSQRRLNTFIYLNPDWDDAYNGHLQLWNREMTRCVQNIRPSLNRFVVFTCTDWSFHGHPEPMALPPGRARRSIAVYYYAQGPRKHEECEHADECQYEPGAFGQVESSCLCRPHSTLFQKQTCGSCTSGACGEASLKTT